MRRWTQQAIAHWKEFQPKRYQELKRSGKLQSEAEAAANLTMKAMQDIQDQGATYNEAWEQTRERYLFPLEEPNLEEEKEPTSWGVYEILTEENERLQKALEELED